MFPIHVSWVSMVHTGFHMEGWKPKISTIGSARQFSCDAPELSILVPESDSASVNEPLHLRRPEIIIGSLSWSVSVNGPQAKIMTWIVLRYNSKLINVGLKYNSHVVWEISSAALHSWTGCLHVNPEEVAQERFLEITVDLWIVYHPQQLIHSHDSLTHRLYEPGRERGHSEFVKSLG